MHREDGLVEELTGVVRVPRIASAEKSGGAIRLRILPGLVCLAIVLDLAAATAAGAVTFTNFTSVDVPGAANTFAIGINDAGQVAGFYGDVPPFFCPGNPNAVDHAFTFDGTTFTNPIDVPGAPSTYAFGINNIGQIAGSYGNAASGGHGFVFNGTNFTNPIDVPGAPNTGAIGINDAGLIAGSYGSFPAPCQPVAGDGFLFDGTTFTNPIDFPGATSTAIFGINNVGQVSGIYVTGGLEHGYFFDGTNFNTVDVPAPSSINSVGEINDSSQIVGSFHDFTGMTHGFFFDQTNFFTVDFPGATGTILFGLNNVGQLSGIYADASGVVHGFIATISP